MTHIFPLQQEYMMWQSFIFKSQQLRNLKRVLRNHCSEALLDLGWHNSFSLGYYTNLRILHTAKVCMLVDCPVWNTTKPYKEKQQQLKAKKSLFHVSIFLPSKWEKLWQGHTPHFMVWSRPKCKDCHSELGRDELQSGPLALPWTSEAPSHFSCSSIFHDCQVVRRLRSCVSQGLRRDRTSCFGWLSLSGGRTRWKSSGRWSVCTSVTETSLDRRHILLASEPRTMLLPGSASCCDPFFFFFWLVFLSCQRLQSDRELSLLGLIFTRACYRSVDLWYCCQEQLMSINCYSWLFTTTRT